MGGDIRELESDLLAATPATLAGLGRSTSGHKIPLIRFSGAMAN